MLNIDKHAIKHISAWKRVKIRQADARPKKVRAYKKKCVCYIVTCFWFSLHFLISGAFSKRFLPLCRVSGFVHVAGKWGEMRRNQYTAMATHSLDFFCLVFSSNYSGECSDSYDSYNSYNCPFAFLRVKQNDATSFSFHIFAGSRFVFYRFFI